MGAHINRTGTVRNAVTSRIRCPWHTLLSRQRQKGSDTR